MFMRSLLEKGLFFRARKLVPKKKDDRKVFFNFYLKLNIFILCSLTSFRSINFKISTITISGSERKRG